MNKKTVWKFPFKVQDSITIEMPNKAAVIHVDAQKGFPCLWVLVDPEAQIVERHFQLRGTGHPFNGNEGEHIGSFMLLEGSFVFHLFEEA